MTLALAPATSPEQGPRIFGTRLHRAPTEGRLSLSAQHLSFQGKQAYSLERKPHKEPLWGSSQDLTLALAPSTMSS